MGQRLGRPRFVVESLLLEDESCTREKLWRLRERAGRVAEGVTLALDFWGQSFKLSLCLHGLFALIPAFSI